MTEDDMGAENHHTREMYASYGLAMYFAQTVEAGLKSALIMAQLTSKKFSAMDDYDESWALNFKATMGKLMRRIEPFLGDDIALGEDLDLALAIRNQLAHHFFWDHAADARSFAGRDEMIAECMAAVEFFQQVEQRLLEVVRRFSETAGTPSDVFERRLEESMEDILAQSEEIGSKTCGRCLTSMEAEGSERQPYWKCPTCGSVALS